MCPADHGRQGTLTGRLAARLFRLAEEQETGAHGPVELPFAYSQGDLAAMIGGARQSVNRVLRGLERDGLVRIEGDHLFISNVERLEARGRL